MKVRARVERILLEDGRAIGVRLADGAEIRARHVVSNADPHATFGLLPEEALPRRVRLRLRRTPYSVSSLALFLAAELDPRAKGLDSGNVWAIRTPDVEETHRFATAADPLAAGPIPGVFLTCTTLKDPSERADGIATFEAFTFVSYEAFRRFEGTSPDERPPAYEALKEQLGDRLLGELERIVPGLRGALRFRAVGTPLTNRHYVASTAGSLYGIEKNALQVGPLGFPTRTRIPGLWMCGASTLGHGVAGATFSGLAAARDVLGVRTSELLTERGQALRIWPSDHPERWPAEARRVA